MRMVNQLNQFSTPYGGCEILLQLMVDIKNVYPMIHCIHSLGWSLLVIPSEIARHLVL